jgi:hypothetical protein
MWWNHMNKSRKLIKWQSHKQRREFCRQKRGFMTFYSGQRVAEDKHKTECGMS